MIDSTGFRCGWFESHLEPALGIDVYASEFDPARGYAIITTPTVRLLLLRCEGLAVAPRALGELVGSDSDIPVPRLNVGSEKGYGELYDQFRPVRAALARPCSTVPTRPGWSRTSIRPTRSTRFRAHLVSATTGRRASRRARAWSRLGNLAACS